MNSVKLMTMLPVRLYHTFMNKFYHLSISWSYLSLNGSLLRSNGSLFEIPDKPPCYVRKCSLFASLLLISLYEMCLGVLCYNSLYALSLHSTLACLWVPFLCLLGRIREQEHVILKLKLILHMTQTKT